VPTLEDNETLCCFRDGIFVDNSPIFKEYAHRVSKLRALNYAKRGQSDIKNIERQSEFSKVAEVGYYRILKNCGFFVPPESALFEIYDSLSINKEKIFDPDIISSDIGWCIKSTTEENRNYGYIFQYDTECGDGNQDYHRDILLKTPTNHQYIVCSVVAVREYGYRVFIDDIVRADVVFNLPKVNQDPRYFGLYRPPFKEGLKNSKRALLPNDIKTRYIPGNSVRFKHIYHLPSGIFAIETNNEITMFHTDYHKRLGVI
jgi:hypothetical protein